MNEEQIEKEYKKIDYELFNNKPTIVPYPPNIVKKRELLLYAQVHLSNILEVKFKRDEWDERFETKMYKIVMEKYYNWNEE